MLLAPVVERSDNITIIGFINGKKIIYNYEVCKKSFKFLKNNYYVRIVKKKP